MSQSETLGDRLTRAMKRAGLKNPDIAEATGVHLTTVSRWRSDNQAPEDAQLNTIAALLRKHGLDIGAAWLRYGDDGAPGHADLILAKDERVMAVREALGYARGGSAAFADGVAIYWPRALQIIAAAFEQEALTAGASEHFMAYARQRLKDPDLLAFYAGGRDARPMTDQEQRDDYATVIAELRAQLKSDVARRKAE